LTRVVKNLKPKVASEQNYRPFPVQSLGRDLAKSWSLIQGVLPDCRRIRSGNSKEARAHKGCRAIQEEEWCSKQLIYTTGEFYFM
jgi:hypothetical protein